MKTITLKADDQLHQTISRLANLQMKTRSAVIREAIFSYEMQLAKEALKQQVKQASMIVRMESLKTTQDLQDSNLDGI
ncbi:MAG: hypothetical protein OXC84_11525 [Gammaproteobacteria bacterium]|nr:hypothetical protein [Gammaproteobacteria bacterium]